jgi:hypothetical protein
LEAVWAAWVAVRLKLRLRLRPHPPTPDPPGRSMLNSYLQLKTWDSQMKKLSLKS